VYASDKEGSWRAESGYEFVNPGKDLTVRLSPRTILNQGCKCLEREDFIQAIAHFSETIKIDASYAPAYANRGWAYYKCGKYQKALADITQAIASDPKIAPYYNMRGCIYSELQDTDHAIADFLRTIELDSAYASAYFNVGQIYRERRQLEKAVEMFQRRVSLNPSTSAWAMVEIGIIHYARGRTAEARDAFHQSLENPNHSDKSTQLSYQALAQLGIGLVDQALQTAVQAISQWPTHKPISMDLFHLLNTRPDGLPGLSELQNLWEDAVT
jgi:tetratricopeptide (TPR) repeat protein